jgi:hypothetical protein
MEQTFVASYDEFGEVKEVDLCPGGSDKVVTVENREEFVRLACRSRMTRGREEQMECFLRGFDEILPLEQMQVGLMCACVHGCMCGSGWVRRDGGLQSLPVKCDECLALPILLRL